ncbi:hypothetical protein L9F63_012673, partial [Diploptera punctata]
NYSELDHTGIEKLRIEGELSTVTSKKFRSFTMNYNEQITMPMYDMAKLIMH